MINRFQKVRKDWCRVLCRGLLVRLPEDQLLFDDKTAGEWILKVEESSK